MASNFLKRRKILKEINTLDLTPVKQMESADNADGKVDIILPRFRNQFLKRALQPRKKGDNITIHLDELGSAIWRMIDGTMNVHQICSKLQTEFPEKLNPPEETEERVAKFLSLLYQERYITFREISE
jgi:hypothetical protein